MKKLKGVHVSDMLTNMTNILAPYLHVLSLNITSVINILHAVQLAICCLYFLISLFLAVYTFEHTSKLLSN